MLQPDVFGRSAVWIIQDHCFKYKIPEDLLMPMKNRLPMGRISVASLLLFLGLTLLDIIVVESYYGPRGAWDRIWLWHYVYAVLWISLPLVLCVRLRRILPASVVVAFLFGIEDTAFYLLQLRSPVYLGVAILGIWEPTLQIGLALNLLGLAVIQTVAWVDARQVIGFPLS